ncbi:hypothetical protein SprV_0702413200 [Sparganum proliferum]
MGSSKNPKRQANKLLAPPIASSSSEVSSSNFALDAGTKPNFTCTAYDDDRSPGNIFGLPTWLNDLADLSQSDSSDSVDVTSAIQLLTEDTLRKSIEQATAVGNDPALTNTMDLIEALGCDGKTFGLLSAITSRRHVTTLARAYCLLPVRSRRFLRNALEGRLAAYGDSPFTVADRLLGTFSILASAYSSVRPTDQTANKTRNMTALLETVKRVSIPVCGSRPGQNDFLNLADLLSTQSGKLQNGSSKDSTSNFSQYLLNIPTNATACAALNAIFAIETISPLTLRLKTLMQGRILYHPVTPLTQRIVSGANQTMRMFERLKIASSAWRGGRRRHWSRGGLRPVENPPLETDQPDEKKTEEFDSTFSTDKAVVSLEESSNTGSIDESSGGSPADIRFAPSDVQPL